MQNSGAENKKSTSGSFVQEPASLQGSPKNVSHPVIPGPNIPDVLHIAKTAVLASSLILVILGFAYVFFCTLSFIFLIPIVIDKQRRFPPGH